MRKFYLITLFVISPFVIFAQSASEFKQKGDEAYLHFNGLSTSNFEELKWSALMNILNNYESAIKENKEYIDEISEKLLDVRSQFVEAGRYYYGEEKYDTAIIFYEIYCNYPDMDIFKGKDIKALLRNSSDTEVLYNTAILYYKLKNNEKALEILEKIQSENYIPNKVYTKEDVYDFFIMANESCKTKQLSLAEYASKKFKKNKFYISILQADIQKENYAEIISYIDKPLKYKKDACPFYVIKIHVYTMLGKLDEAEKVSKIALKKDKDCYLASENLAYAYITKCLDLMYELVDAKDSKVPNLKKQIEEYYYKGENAILRSYKTRKKLNSSIEDKKIALNFMKNLYTKYDIYKNEDKAKKLKYVELELANLEKNK